MKNVTTSNNSSGLNDRIEQLSPVKQALLELKLHNKPKPATLCIPQRDHKRSIPLSFSQLGAWMLESQLPDDISFSMPIVLHLNGRLKMALLEQSIDWLIQRHESLRTYFAIENGRPVQKISTDITSHLSAVDLRSSQSPTNETTKIIQRAVSQPFDLLTGPLCLFKLVRIADHEYQLLIVLHHIITDGWSTNVLISDLSAAYSDFSAGHRPTLSNLSWQYSDYAVWQHAFLQGDTLDHLLGYWKLQLAGTLPVLNLPTDYSPVSESPYRIEQQILNLPIELTEHIKTTARQGKSSLFTVLLTAFNILLYRYTEQTDIIVGTPHAGRDRIEFKNINGLFLNTLALRTDLSGKPSFQQLLSRVQKTVQAGFIHKDLPLEVLLREVTIARKISHMPIFQVMLVLHNQRQTENTHLNVGFGDLTLQSEVSNIDNHNYTLTLHCIETLNGLRITLFYNATLFKEKTIGLMLGYFQTLLHSIVDTPEMSIAELPLLTERERHQLLVEWNATATDFPKHQCAHQLFEQQVANAPDAIALIFENQSLSYRELNIKANQLAHYLLGKGVVNGAFVGVCMDRSIDFIVGLLAILKAGAAYIPLDPTYPQQRLADMLKQADISIIITRYDEQAMLSTEITLHTIVLDGVDANAIAGQQKDNLNVKSSAKQPAYVMFTSGSSGKPKAVLIPHYAINRLLINSHYITLTALDRIAQLSNISFDAATFEIWGALLAGARLVIIPKTQLLSLPKFGQTLVDSGITTLFLTTALLNQIIENEPNCLTSIKNLLFGGETIDVNRIRQLLAHQLPQQRLLHVYGPTESTTFATWYEIKTVAENAKTIPIGKPLANTTTYILDQQLQPQPIGITGELYLGGEGIALEYHRQPEYNHEKFLDNPFNSQERLYKTGDFVRYLADGNIEFIARVDNQIKLRGFRIELGEIESILRQHTQINDALVIVNDDPITGKKLFAYIRKSAEQSLTRHKLRHYLKQTLPDYMIPAELIFLQHFPLTENGKINRQALPEPDKTVSDTASVYSAPSSAREKILIDLWQQVLNVEKISINDNFFEIGGHSLLAISLTTKIKEKFKQSVSVELLFQYPTVQQLSEVLEHKNHRPEKHLNPILTTINKGGRLSPFFWLHGATIIPLIHEHIDSDRPFYFLNHQSLNGQKAKHITIPEMATYYIQAILQVDSKGPYYLGGYSIGGMIMYEIARQLCEQGKTVAFIFLLDPTKIKTDSTDNNELALKKMSLSGEYHQLKKLGYLSYFHFNRKLINKTCQDTFTRGVIQLHLILGRPLPEKLNWPYLHRLYEQAASNYRPQSIVDGLTKAVIIQVKKSASNKSWGNIFNQQAAIYYMNTTHLKLKEKPNALNWINILAQLLN